VSTATPVGVGLSGTPSSPGQERLWFLEQLEPGNPIYNLPFRFHIRGELDIEGLQTALDQLVVRHEVLRTRFVAVDGRPTQVVMANLSIPLAVIDLASLEPAQQEDDVERRSRAEARRRFNLAEAPLLRTTILRLGPQEHILLLTMHHIVFDGWSLGVFLHELRIMYEGAVSGVPASLPELRLQYSDHALHQRRWLQSTEFREQLEHWTQQLRGAPTILELPSDRPRPRIQTFKGAAYRFDFPPDLVDALRAAGRENGVTLFMTLLAGLKVLLSRYAGREDVLVGTLVANRGDSDVEALIGFFANTLALRTSLDGNPTFLELLARVREVCIEAYANQDLPFERLVEELQPERDLGHMPLTQVGFVLQRSVDDSLPLGNAEMRMLEQIVTATEFDMALTVDESRDALRGMIEYSSDLFDRDTVARLAGHLLTLLAGAMKDPNRRISDLPLLTVAEIRQLDGWNDVSRIDPAGSPIHILFEEQALRNRDAVAIVFEECELTYGELNERANRLARHLRGRGVHSESVVGICLDRSLDLVVTLMATLKAGGAYLPLDPTYPAQRVVFMLEDSGAVALVTDERGLDVRPEGSVQVIRLGQHAPAIDEQSGEDLELRTTPDQLAYVMYTSGSTGKPKGVAVSHANVSSFFTAVEELLQPNSPGTWLALTSVSFDISVVELFWTLSRGFTVVLQPSELESVRPTHIVNRSWLGNEVHS